MGDLTPERRRLLNPHGTENDPGEASPAVPARQFIYTATLCILVNTACITASAFSDVSMNQLVEGAACQREFLNVTDPYHDTRCKEDTVQSQLSLVNGWQTTFGMIPGLLVAIPYGVFADTYGPRALLPLTFLGSTLTQLAQQLICQFRQ